MPPTKTDSVRNAVFRAILHGEYAPGDRVPAEREMAARTATSRVTVRRAFGELSEAGILARVRGRGTFVATHARGHPKHAHQIALLASVRDPFALEFIRALEGELALRDALLILRLTGEDPAREEEAAIDLVAKGVRNLVVWPSGGRFASATFARLRVLGTNMVFFDRMLPGPYADYVGLDNRHAVRALMRHALERGERTFVFVSHEGLDADSDRQREEAFEAICVEGNVRHRVVRVPWRGNVREVIAENRHEWFSPARRVAAVCVNDAVALDVREVRGRDAAIYGIDGLPAATVAGIPSIQQPMVDMARRAIALLASQRRKVDLWRARRLYCKGVLIDPL
jgi:DNA-binding LacI/PurR family transcriptional regulator